MRRSRDEVFQLRLLDLERHLERLLERETGLRAIVEILMQSAQPHDGGIVERDRTRLIELPFQFEHGGYQSERADVAGFVARHAEPEIVQPHVAAKTFAKLA